MARHHRITSSENDEPSLDISSLIDVCFLLLIYFIVTTQIIRKEQELSSTIPSDKPLYSPATIAPLSLLLEANGHVSIQNETGLIELIETNPAVRDLPTLSRRLEFHQSAARVSGQSPVVQLKVDGESNQQRVTDVLNALAGAGIKDITFVDLLPPT